MSGRFDYVKYDNRAIELQIGAKKLCQELESFIVMVSRDDSMLQRPSKLALNSLEECYMWIGKLIRDEQVAFRKVESQ